MEYLRDTSKNGNNSRMLCVQYRQMQNYFGYFKYTYTPLEVKVKRGIVAFYLYTARCLNGTTRNTFLKSEAFVWSNIVAVF